MCASRGTFVDARVQGGKGGKILRSELRVRWAVGVVASCVFACAWGVARGSVGQEQAVESLEAAFKAPDKVKRLVLQSEDPELKHLPARMGTLVNLETLELACLEKLEDLPEEIGALRKLEQLIIDNGNGCSMNVQLPRSVGRLESLRVLRLYGALDAGGTDDEAAASKPR